MRILVTGGTGYVGSAVVARLLGAGRTVVALARSDDAAQRLRGAGCEVVRASLEETRTLREAAAEADAVVHAAATGDPSQGPVDAAAVRALLAGAGERGGTVVYTSGLWILGETGDAPAAEDAPLRPAALVAWRPAVERAVRDAEGARGVVVRPGVVYGAGGGIPGAFVDAGRRKGVVRYVGDGSQRWPTVHRDDLADLYLLALDARAGTIFHGAAGESVPVREVAAAAARATGARAEAWPLEEARGRLGAYADALALDQRVTSEVAREAGWRPSRPGVLEALGADV